MEISACLSLFLYVFFFVCFKGEVGKVLLNHHCMFLCCCCCCCSLCFFNVSLPTSPHLFFSFFLSSSTMNEQQNSEEMQ